MILRNKDRFLDLISVGGGVSSISRLSHEGSQVLKANGFFFEKDGRVFGLGVDHGEIWLMLDGELRKAGSGTKVTVEDADGVRTFSAFDSDHLISSVSYPPEAPYWNLFDMEDEDVDGFTWIRNVLASPERTAVFKVANG